MALINYPTGYTFPRLTLPSPDGVANPCLECLPDCDLDKALLVILANFGATGYTLPTDLDLLLADSLLFTKLSETDLKRAVINLWANHLSATGDITRLNSRIRNLNAEQVRAATIWCLAKYLNSLGD